MNDESIGTEAGRDGGTVLRGIAWRLVARRVLIARLAAVAVVGTLVASLVLPRWYSTSVSFTPQQGRRPNASGNLSGLAAQFGVAIPGGDASQSPNFYAQLATSRTILGELADTGLPLDSAGRDRAVPMATLLDVDEEAPRRRRDEIIVELRKRITASADVRTGVVTVSIRMHDPVAAWRLGDRLVQAMTRYNLVTRQGQARAERVFAEQRLADARAELRASEEKLRQFLVANRVYERSPTLALEEQRLQREVSTKSQVFSGIVQAYEQARLEEVRDTPVLSVIDRPLIPAKPDSLRLPLRLIVAAVVGLLVGVLLVVGADVVARLRGGVPPIASPERLAREVAADLVRPWRLLVNRPT